MISLIDTNKLPEVFISILLEEWREERAQTKEEMIAKLKSVLEENAILTISGASVLLLHGRDAISLETNLPDPESHSSGDKFSLNFRTPIDEGVATVKSIFGIESEVINARHRHKSFRKSK